MLELRIQSVLSSVVPFAYASCRYLRRVYGFHFLIAVLLLCFGAWEVVGQNPRVKWGGLAFRGKAVDRETLFAFVSKPDVTEKLQEALSKVVKQADRQDCSILVGKDFEFAAGESLVLSCVIEDEDVLIAKIVSEGGDEYYGQVTIAASLVLFDFNLEKQIVVSSSIVSSIIEFGRDTGMTSHPTPEQIGKFVSTLLFGSADQGVDGSAGERVDLVSRVKAAVMFIPVKEKGAFDKLQVSLPEIDEQTLREMNALDDLQKQRVRRQISQKIAASLVQEFRLNVLPLTDGDSTLQTMTVSFADKTRFAGGGSAEKVFELKPPTVVAKTTITGGTDYIEKKFSNKLQTVKAFGSQTEINFFDVKQDKLKFKKVWAYGINRKFAPAYAEKQAKTAKRLYHRQAIENGFQKQFMEVVPKEKAWKDLVARLAL